jgi:hypothetical protein
MLHQSTVEQPLHHLARVHAYLRGVQTNRVQTQHSPSTQLCIRLLDDRLATHQSTII